MPPSAVTCPGCQTRLKVTDQMLGKTIQCPKCQKALKLGGKPAGDTTPAAEKQPTFPQKKADPQPVKKPAAMPSMDLGDDPPKKTPRKQKQKPVEEDEVLDESSLEQVEDEVLDEASLETVEDEPAPKKTPQKKRRDDDEEDDSGVAGAKLNTEEHGDPLLGLGLSRAQIKEVKGELSKGERVVWAGTTSDRVDAYNAGIARLVGFILMPIGFGIAGLGLFLWLTGVADMIVGLVLAGFGVIFGGIACLAIFAPYFYQRGKQLKEDGQRDYNLQDLFILTNRRCLCWIRRLPGRCFSYNPLRVRDMERKDHGSVKGAGDLVFDTQEEYHTTGGSRHGSVHTEVIPIGFIGIDNVRDVERLVRHTLLRGGF